ncbi:DNA topoisomerase 3 [Oligella sp. MSHR50489EDL]|uniref:DNA topoisomerase n=1 Tax=Oligella sp. MSHR50489EDL TaxID=3139409 RepID=UPI003D814A7B
MKKTLIIAEKPSVARDIAKALDIGNSLENDAFIVSHCIGHLVTITYPIEDNAKLPILPDEFNLGVLENTKEQYSKLAALMNRDDVTTVINACDAGREGELIFRLVYEKAKCTKKIERMWLQSMTPDAIKTAYKERSDGTDYDSLYAAARCRTEADWLVGINGSRAVKNAVGRVMTPTLAMVVERYEANKNFKQSTYFEVIADFKLAAGNYQGKLLVNDSNEEQSFETVAAAQAFIANLNKGACKVVDTTTLKKKLPLPLFHLTSLQQEANKKYGFSAATTLQITQSLYEQHKAVTYPRTDSNALPSDYVETVKTAVKQLVNRYPSCDAIMNNNWIDLNSGNKRIFNDEKISDHFAIVPTGVEPKDLNDKEAKIYDLITKRFLAAFYPEAEFYHTLRITYVGASRFKTVGNVLIKSGWLAVYDNLIDDDDEKEAALVVAAPDEKAVINEIKSKECKTRPPQLYTEATLLRAMETAGKDVENDEYADSLKGKGIGTPATRAAIIEKLKKKTKFDAYMQLQKKSLVPTERGLAIIHHLRNTAPTLISAELTGEWEHKLGQVEKNELEREQFMREIHQYVFDLVGSAEQTRQHTNNIGACPCCDDGELFLSKFSYLCNAKCGFKINKEIAGHKLSEKEVMEIIEKGRTPKISGFVSKANKSFTATLVLNRQEKKLNFKF